MAHFNIYEEELDESPDLTTESTDNDLDFKSVFQNYINKDAVQTSQTSDWDDPFSTNPIVSTLDNNNINQTPEIDDNDDDDEEIDNDFEYPSNPALNTANTENLSDGELSDSFVNNDNGEDDNNGEDGIEDVFSTDPVVSQINSDDDNDDYQSNSNDIYTTDNYDLEQETVTSFEEEDTPPPVVVKTKSYSPDDWASSWKDPFSNIAPSFGSTSEITKTETTTDETIQTEDELKANDTENSDAFGAFSTTASNNANDNTEESADDAFSAFGAKTDTSGDNNQVLDSNTETEDAFGAFAKQTEPSKKSDDFDSFGNTTGDINNEKPKITSANAATTDDFSSFSAANKKETKLDEFGSFGSFDKSEIKNTTTTTTTNKEEDPFGDFNTSSKVSAPSKTEEDSTSPDGAFGAFGSFDSAKKPQDKNSTKDFGDFSSFDKPTTTTESKDTASEEDGFGGFSSFKANKPKTNEATNDDAFGSFSTANASASNDASDAFANFGEFKSTTTTSTNNDGFADFGSFSQPATSKPINANDFSGFSAAPTPAPVAPAISGPSILAVNGLELTAALSTIMNDTFAKELSTLSPANAPTFTNANLQQLLATPQFCGKYFTQVRCKCGILKAKGGNCCIGCGATFVQINKQDHWKSNSVARRMFIKSLHLPSMGGNYSPQISPVVAQKKATTTTINASSSTSTSSATSSGLSPQPSRVHKQSAMNGHNGDGSDGSGDDVSNRISSAIPSDILAPTPTPTEILTPEVNGAVFMPSTNQNNFSTMQTTDITDSPSLSVFDLDFFKSNTTSSTSSTAKPSKKAPSSDLDSFLLDFTPTNQPTNGASGVASSSSGQNGLLSLTEKIETEKVDKKKKDKFSAMLGKIPDLSFMVSKTLVVPASKYKIDIKL